MSERKITGMSAREMRAAAAEIQFAMPRERTPDQPNSQCLKCGSRIYLQPTLLAFVRRGVVDHAKCGGTLAALAEAEG